MFNQFGLVSSLKSRLAQWEVPKIENFLHERITFLYLAGRLSILSLPKANEELLSTVPSDIYKIMWTWQNWIKPMKRKWYKFLTLQLNTTNEKPGIIRRMALQKYTLTVNARVKK